MSGDEPNLREIIGELSSWLDFGASLAEIHRSGLINPDMDPGNLGWYEGKIKMVDYDDVREITFPSDIEKEALAIASLFRNLDDFRISAVRFGFLHAGGAASGHVVEYLRENQGLSPLPEAVMRESQEPPPEVIDRLPVDTDAKTWEQWCEYHSEARVSDEPPVDVFREWFLSREETTEPVYADRYYAEAQVCAGIRELELGAVIEAVLNLQRYAIAVEEPALAAGYAIYLDEIISSIDDDFEREVEEVKRVLDVVDAEIIERLRALKQDVGGVAPTWPFFWFWCVDEARAGRFDPTE